MGFLFKLKNLLKKNCLYYWRLRYLLRKECSLSAAQKYVDGLQKNKNDQTDVALLAKDLHDCAYRYDVYFGEYFFFNFPNHGHDYRKEFAGDVLLEYFVLRVNKIENREKLDNKSCTATLFGRFFKRDVFLITSNNDDQLKGFLTFCGLHNSFIAKPLKSSMGQGIRFFSVKDYPTPEALFDCLVNYYCSQNRMDGCLLEEMLENVEDFKKIHPESLNTIRMPTFRYGGDVKVLHPCCRFGRGKSIVDNAGSGGLICTVDPSTGKIMHVGDERGRKYTCHPDTLFPLEGWQVPQWQDAVNFAKQLADVIPDNGYCAWDIALTPKGWVMIEGNARGQFIWQGPDEKGFKPELLKLLQEMKK